MSSSTKALETYLKPFDSIFDEDGVNEIAINNPCEVWIEKFGQTRVESIEQFTFSYLISLGQLIAQSTGQELSSEKPLLSATLPNGYRVQIVFPPACGNQSVAFAIRKNNPILIGIDKYVTEDTTSNLTTQDNSNEQDDLILKDYLENKQITLFLENAIKNKKNFIISGGTSTGKTSFANSLLAHIDPKERIITIEDAREIILKYHKNKLHLITSKGDQGIAKIDTQDLIEASLRLRPDRIILGELRGKEAFSFLRAINTGHPGSVATLHADSPKMAIEQLKLMVMQAGLGISNQEVEEYILQVVNIIVQIRRSKTSKRYISEIFFNI